MNPLFSPPLEVPTELEAWMRTQSQSAFVGDMLRLLARKGGLTAEQLERLKVMRVTQGLAAELKALEEEVKK